MMNGLWPERDTADGAEPSALGEKELVEKAKRDPQAFGDLYELHYSAILNYFFRRTLNTPLAEELTSETFLKGLLGLRGFRNGVPLRAWLYRIAANELKMHWRKEKNRAKRGDHWVQSMQDVRMSYDQSSPGAEEELRARLGQHARLLEALNTLAPRYREALLLRYFEGLKYEEIALILDKRPGTVKSLVHRGLAGLKRAYDASHATFQDSQHHPACEEDGQR